MTKSAIIIFAVLALVAAVVAFLLSSNKTGRNSVSYEDPSKILFSVPTICDLAPEVELIQSPPTGNDLVQDQDYWRQIKFVPLQNLSNLTNLVAEVREYEKINREKYGWKNTFTRKEYPTPVRALNLSFQKLISSFNPSPDPHTLFLTSGDFNAKVKGGFCLNIKDLGTIYGQQSDDKIFELGFESARTGTISQTGSAQLTAFCQQNQLMMVDWYRREIVDLKNPKFSAPSAKGSRTSP